VDRSTDPVPPAKGIRAKLRRLDRRLSLSLKVVLPMVVVATITVLLVGRAIVGQTREQVTKERAETARDVAFLVGREFARGEQSSVGDLLGDLSVADPLLQGINVYVMQGRRAVVWASTDPAELSAQEEPEEADVEVIRTGEGRLEEDKEEGEHVLEAIEPLRVDGQVVGSVGVYMSLADLDAAVVLSSGRVLLVMSVVAAVAVAAMAAILYVVVFRPAARLSRAARRVAEGDLSVRLPEGREAPGRDELFTVAHEFDRMLRAVEVRSRQLRAAEERYRTLVERIPAIAYTADFGPEGRWHYVAPQIEEVLGYTPAEWTADRGLWWNRLHPEDRERVLEDEEICRRTSGHLAIEYRVLAKDDRVVWIRDDAFVMRDEQGRPLYFHGVLYDITQQKQAEEALRQAYDRERQAAGRLRSLDEMKNAFLSAVSHELRTPLSSVIGFARTLQQEEVNLPQEERRMMFDRLVANAQKLARLLSDLLDLDRLASGVIEPRRQVVDVGALARRVIEEADLGGRPLELTADPAPAFVDPSHVERIIENLIVNAAKHTPPRTAVRLTVTSHPKAVEISVEDQGEGVPDDLKEMVFRPFERGDDNGHAPGTGIGLSLVARFAELHGGRAWVEDRPGGGARFRVSLPGLNLPAPAPTR
jgi:PAS domain S-box-containing protein